MSVLTDSNFSSIDETLMRRALSLAHQGCYSTSPNPKVGCVIAHGEEVVGEGWHKQAGGHHAEIFALEMAKDKAHGATVYVTLEPCAHYGKTPPCADALIRAGVKKVIAAIKDPNPSVCGKGFAMLNAAGIETAYGLLEDEARKINRGFLSRFERNRPFISLKVAQSLDGKIALNNGVSQWITTEDARRDVQDGRAKSCAILTGVGTVLADNPRLNVRDIDTLRQSLRIVVDSNLLTPCNAKICTDGNPTLLVSLPETVIANQYPSQVEIIRIPADYNGRVDLNILMRQLAKRGIGEVWCECGATLSGALLQNNLIDELIIYQAPIILGDKAQSVFSLPELTSLSDIDRWQIDDIRKIGDDIRLVLLPPNLNQERKI
ncbi:MAG: bifunctional diaminohydroxyphosphoribosylaminopyrimidine deaminase/5-amino-6-(5-phosphoribosylamino)uracil reductase RibD [Neisseriaceae bacterium]|nr:bifunctional diaminohydroxyphosphoribosylaminopyrimidine deaminase/5-amino-6-(5-phosphoribosylamino)uracil reductase RibD [Neisseriaceae bacterium]